MSELDFTLTQLAFFTVIVLLTFDAIKYVSTATSCVSKRKCLTCVFCRVYSPVKMFLHVFPGVAPWHVAAVSILLMVYVSTI